MSWLQCYHKILDYIFFNVRLFFYILIVILGYVFVFFYSEVKKAFNNLMCVLFLGRENTYIKAVYELSNLINLRFRTFPYHSDLIFYLSPHGSRYRKACKVAHSHTGNTYRCSNINQDWSMHMLKFQSLRFMFSTLM